MMRLVILASLLGVASSACTYTQVPNAAIWDHNTERLTDKTVSECKEQCCQTSWCKSFDYHKETSICDLSDKSASDVGGLKTDYTNDPFDHYAREEASPTPAPPTPAPPTPVTDHWGTPETPVTLTPHPTAADPAMPTGDPAEHVNPTTAALSHSPTATPTSFPTPEHETKSSCQIVFPGETVAQTVPHGYKGPGEGVDWCNQCLCDDGDYTTCTARECSKPLNLAGEDLPDDKSQWEECDVVSCQYNTTTHLTRVTHSHEEPKGIRHLCQHDIGTGDCTCYCHGQETDSPTATDSPTPTPTTPDPEAACIQQLDAECDGSITTEMDGDGKIDKVICFGGENSGTIPDCLGDFSQLEVLQLYSGKLTGSIPESLGKLVNLKVLQLDRNQLTGSIPESLGELTNLVSIELKLNSLTGTIPESLGKLVNLQRLTLTNNQLSGTIPVELNSVPFFAYSGNNFS